MVLMTWVIALSWQDIHTLTANRVNYGFLISRLQSGVKATKEVELQLLIASVLELYLCPI